MVSSMYGDALVRSTRKIVPCLQSMVVVASRSGAAWLLLVLGSCSLLRETSLNTGLQHLLWHSEAKDDALPSKTVFQHNNHPKHTIKMTTALQWSSMSPNLNPTEHMWGILKRKVEKHHLSNIQQLRDVIMEEWKRMPATSCAALVNSMPRRIKAVLDKNGAPTKYWHFGHSFDMFFYTSCTLTIKYIQV